MIRGHCILTNLAYFRFCFDRKSLDSTQFQCHPFWKHSESVVGRLARWCRKRQMVSFWRAKSRQNLGNVGSRFCVVLGDFGRFLCRFYKIHVFWVVFEIFLIKMHNLTPKCIKIQKKFLPAAAFLLFIPYICLKVDEKSQKLQKNRRNLQKFGNKNGLFTPYPH